MPEDLPDVYLRFEGFKGECNDDKHPGSDGWITIKSFSFGFGFPGQDAAADPPAAAQAQTKNGATGAQNASPGASAGKPASKKGSGMKSGALTFDRISFTKSSDSTSHQMMQWCHEGTEIPMVELRACRYGGALGDEKLPFLHMIFSSVHLKGCKLNLTTENLPTEDLEFEYEKVEMKCLWTDNATGNRLTSKPIGVGWILESQKSIDDEPPDPED